MQELAMKIGAAPAAGNLFLSSTGQKAMDASSAGDLSVADKFTALLHSFANAQDAAAEQLAAEADPALAGLNITKLQTGADLEALLGGRGLSQPCIVNASADISADVKAENETNISPEMMAQIAALMKDFPHLQDLLHSKVDLKVLAEAIDYLQATKTPDLAQFKLPEEIKDVLMKLAGNRDTLASLGAVVQKMEQNPDLAKAMKLAADQASTPVKDVIAHIDTTDVDTDAGKLKLVKGITLNDAANAKSHNVLAEARAVADILKPIRADFIKPMSDTITAADADLRIDATLVASSESNAALSFDQAMNQALHAADALQAGKHSIMSAAGIDAYAMMRAAPGAVPSHIASMQVAIQLQRNLQAGRANNFFIQLQPEELGRIEVTMKFEGNRVRAIIAAEKEETLALLKNDSKALSHALQSAGLETDAGTLEFSLGQNFQNFDEAKKNHQHDRSFGTMIADKDLNMDTKQDLTAAHIMMLAEGRVDVKL